MGSVNFYVTIHIQRRKTSKENFAIAITIAQWEWTLAATNNTHLMDTRLAQWYRSHFKDERFAVYLLVLATRETSGDHYVMVTKGISVVLAKLCCTNRCCTAYH